MRNNNTVSVMMVDIPRILDAQLLLAQMQLCASLTLKDEFCYALLV
jgi:hypothetical protein